MADQYIKFLATNAGDLTSSQNIVDVELPGGAVYDLSDSYLQVTASVTATDAGAGTGTGVYSPELVFATSSNHFPNQSLVKNCSLTTDGKGQIESLRRCDVISQIKETLSRSQRQDASEAYLSANSVADAEGSAHYSPFLDMRKTGTTASSLRSVPLPIRLGDLMDSCETSYYDARRLGTSRFRFELHAPTTITARQTIPASTVGLPWINLTNLPAAAAGGEESNIFTTQAAVANCLNIPSIKETPLYVGMKIKISATNSGTGAVSGVSVITALAFDEAAGQMTITIANVAALNRAAGQTLTAITISEITQPAGFTVTFEGAQLVAKRLGNPGPSREMVMPFRTWTTIQDQGVAGANFFQRQYELQPECDGVLVTFPGASTPWSINPAVETYRLRLNQQDLTDRDVGVSSPLYYDQVSSTLDALEMPTRNLRLNVGDCSAQTYANAYPNAGVDGTTISVVGSTYAAATGVVPTGGSGSGCVISITSVNGAGGITGIAVTTRGQGYVAGDVLTVPGGDGAGRITVNTVAQSQQVVVPSALPQTLGSKSLQCNIQAPGGEIDQIVIFASVPRQLIV